MVFIHLSIKSSIESSKTIVTLGEEVPAVGDTMDFLSLPSARGSISNILTKKQKGKLEKRR